MPPADHDGPGHVRVEHRIEGAEQFPDGRSGDGRCLRIALDRQPDRQWRQPGQVDRGRRVQGLNDRENGGVSAAYRQSVRDRNAALGEYGQRQRRQRCRSVQCSHGGPSGSLTDPEARSAVAEQPADAVRDRHIDAALHADRRRAGPGDNAVAVDFRCAREITGQQIGAERQPPGEPHLGQRQPQRLGVRPAGSGHGQHGNVRCAVERKPPVRAGRLGHRIRQLRGSDPDPTRDRIAAGGAPVAQAGPVRGQPDGARRGAAGVDCDTRLGPRRRGGSAVSLRFGSGVSRQVSVRSSTVHGLFPWRLCPPIVR